VGTSTISNANLTFNLDSSPTGRASGAGTKLNVGSTTINFGSSVVLTLNLENEPSVIPAYTPYVLIAGNDGTGADQYTGLNLGASSGNLSTGLTTIINGSGEGQAGNLTLLFTGATNQTFYGASSYLALYQNSSTGVDDIEVLVVPEPSTWALMLGGLGLLIVWQRRRSSRS
jgi:hypothetical protein